MAPVEPEEISAIDPERARRVEALEGWLGGCAVREASFVAHKLYTWTRAAQIEELRGAPRGPLLSRDRGGGGVPSRFDLALADDPHPLARFLRRADRRARRFAWPAPWATRQGWEGGDYGDRLIEVTLREGTWTARFDPRATPRWRVLDADGAEVDAREVERAPERVGAVYHVGDGPRAFREVVLVSEARIGRWAYATPALEERARADAARLRELAALWREEPREEVGDLEAWLRAGWAGAEASSLEDRYRACLALGSEAYAPAPERLEAIAAALEAMPADAPIEREGMRAARRGGPAPSGTWCDPTMGCP